MAPPARRARPEPALPPRERARTVLAGRAWIDGRLRSVEIAIDELGRIRSTGPARSAERRHDVGQKVILPAATDVHVHFRDPPGTTATESIATGTVQAALGGVGLVGDMPNTEPPTDSVERLADKAERVRARAAVDVLLFAAATDASRAAVLAPHAGAFKVYLSPTTGVDDPVPLGSLGPLFGELARSGLPVTVHAEDPQRFRTDVAANGPAGWNRARPPAAESAAVDAVLRAAPPGLRLLLAHLSTSSLAAAVRDRGAAFEVSPQHLLLSERSGSDPRFKVNPPLRSEAERAGIWSMFTRGEVPIVASDHAPHPVEAKQRRFDAAPSGMPGTETMLPLLLARVRAGEVDLPTVLACACDRPARWFGQPMGRIAIGHRANLLVVDFTARRRIVADRLHAPAVWSAFEGREAIFPVEHWRDGERIVDGGEYVGRPSGRTVRPEFAPAAPTDRRGPG